MVYFFKKKNFHTYIIKYKKPLWTIWRQIEDKEKRSPSKTSCWTFGLENSNTFFYQHAMVYVVVSSVSELKQGKATISNLGYDNTVVSENTPNGAMSGLQYCKSLVRGKNVILLDYIKSFRSIQGDYYYYWTLTNLIIYYIEKASDTEKRMTVFKKCDQNVWLVKCEISIEAQDHWQKAKHQYFYILKKNRGTLEISGQGATESLQEISCKKVFIVHRLVEGISQNP